MKSHETLLPHQPHQPHPAPRQAGGWLLLLFALLLTGLAPRAGAAIGDTWTWRNPLPQGNPIQAVTHANGQFWAVGGAGTVLSSTDGVAWTVRNAGTTAQLNVIAGSGSQLVAVGDGGTILTSPDGTTWTARTSNTSNILLGIAWSGSQFVAVGNGGTIRTSPDGVTWTARTSNTTEVLWSIAWSGSQFVAVGDGGTILTSPDGVTWTARTSNTTQPLYGIAWNGSQFVAVGLSGTILTSPDGGTWTARTSDTPNELYGIAGNGSQFVAVGNSGTIRTSPDGVTWTAQTSNTTQILRGIAGNGSQFVAVGSGGTIQTSPDGVTWTARTSGTSNTLNGIAWNGSQFVAVGNGGTIRTSPDGVTWTARTSGTSNTLNGIAGNGSQFVAVGNSGTILTSPDGGTWTARTSNTTQLLLGIAGNGSQFVAVGFNGTILTSPDGVTWTARTSNTTEYLSGIAGSGSQFVAVGFNGTILGTPWSTTTTLTSSLNPASFGQSVTLTATVNPSLATGTVSFQDGGVEIGTGTLSGGSATYVSDALSAGSHSLTAVYAGDSSYGGSTSNTVTQVIDKLNTATALVSSLNPSLFGQTVTFTATVSPATSGTVTFKDGAATLGSVSLSGSQAQFPTAALTAGSHAISADYLGNAAHHASTSNTVNQTVNPAETAITVTTSPAGLPILVDGVSYTAPQVFNWTIGGSHTLAVVSPQTAPGTRYHFSAWSDGGAQSHAITVPATPAAYTASFATEYQLTTAISPAASGYVVPNNGPWYAAGSTVNLSATTNAGYSFGHWTGGVADSASATTTVSMDGPQSVTANLNGVPALKAMVTGKSGAASARTWTLSLANSGTGTAGSAEITGLALSLFAGPACTPVVQTTAPVSVGDVAAGGSQSANLMVDFSACANTSKFRVQIDYRYQDGGATRTGSTSYSNMLR